MSNYGAIIPIDANIGVLSVLKCRCAANDPIRETLKSKGHYRRVARTLAVLTVSLLLLGCTNSKLIISPLYNRLDNQIRDEFNKLGDFNTQQKDAFEQAVGTFHVWHRQNEMPQYASLIQELASSIQQPGRTSRENVNEWADNIESFAKSVRECHPVNFLVDTIQTLSDKEVTFIEKRFASERKKNRERRKSRTQEERIERRLANTVKWAGRIGWDFTQVQKDIVRAGLLQQPSLRDEYVALSTEWTNYLFILARNQSNPNYHRDMSNHIAKLWTLMEKGHPEKHFFHINYQHEHCTT